MRPRQSANGSMESRDQEETNGSRENGHGVWLEVAKHVKSNAIVLVREDRTIGIGAGQMSRVDSTRLAVMKAQSSTKGTVLASDAMFPFRDGVDTGAEAGASAIIQPGARFEIMK